MTASSIEIAFTRSDYYMSKLIRRVTGEDVSHCVILVDDLWVIHSNFIGVHAEYIGDFCEHSQIVTRIPMPLDRERVLDTLDKLDDAGYDFGGMAFLGICLTLRKWLPWIVPKQNLWQSSGMFLCTEFVTELLDGKADSMITPGQLRDRLMKQYSTIGA